MRATTVVLFAALLFIPAAAGRQLDDRWQVKVNGTHFTGTYTNTTASVVNGFAVGTGLKDKNAVTSFTIAGQTCGLYAPYGSAYCYTNIAVKPGETVTFEGNTAQPVGAEGFQMCDTADRGADNTCQDVKVAAPTAPSSNASITAALAGLAAGIKWEHEAIDDLDAGKSAVLDLNKARVNLHFAEKTEAKIPGAKPEEDETATAEHLDDKAESALYRKDPGAVEHSKAWITSALADKRSAVAGLKKLQK